MKAKPFQTFLFTLLVVSILASAACKRTGQTAQTGQPATAGAAPEQYHEGVAGTPPGEVKYFKGSIGNTLGLQMRLTRSGENLTGTYFYQKVGTKIDLKGTIANDGTVNLQEFDSGGKQTGLFKGIWKPGEDGVIGISGEWSKPDGAKKTAFSLHEEPIELTGGVEIVAKQIKETNKQANYEVAAEYPQLSNALNANFEKFNKEVKNLVLRKVNEFKKQVSEDTEPIEGATTASYIDVGYTINLAKDDLISIQFDVSDYYRGAAHPNSYSEVVNYDLKNGKPLKLDDLFKPGSKYLPTISSYCINDLKKQSKSKDSMLDAESIESGAAANSKNYQSWTITKKGIGVNFDPYQVGPYAAGPQFVLVPYSALKDLINHDGPAGQFVK
jgi:hypothetical protein